MHTPFSQSPITPRPLGSAAPKAGSLARASRVRRCLWLALSWSCAACSGSDTSAGASGGSVARGGASAQGGAASLGGASTLSGGATSAAQGGSSAGNGSSNGGRSAQGGASASSGGAPGLGGSSAGGNAGNNSSGFGGASAGAGSGGSASGGRAASGGSASGGAATAGSANAGAASGGSASGGSGAFHPCPSDGSACKIMPFGDSITDGFGTEGAYRVELFRLAHQAGKKITFVGTGSNGPAQVDGVAFPPNHEGHSGFTIDPIGGRSGISPLVVTVMPQFKPHIITLMIGTNDAIDNAQMSNAPTRLGTLIDSIFSQLPDVLLVVAQPIPSQDDALNGRLQTYNQALPAVVKTRADAGRHILLVDMYKPFTDNPSYKTQLLKDTWHPNEAGHVILGGRWYSVLASYL